MVNFSGKFAIFLLLSLFLPSLQAGTVQDSTGTYYLYKPQGTDSAPAIVFLHGQGGDETQGRNVFEVYAKQRGYVLIAPKGVSPSQSWTFDGGAAVRKIVEKVCSDGGVDRNRILLVGYSAGGCAAYNFGTACADLYAAVAVVNAYMAPGSADLSKKLPFFILECEGDPNLPSAKQAKSTLENAGFPVTMEILPGGGHGYPTSVASPKILDWFEKTVQGTGSEPSPGDDDDDDDSGSSNDGNNDEGSSSTGDDDDDDSASAGDDDDDSGDSGSSDSETEDDSSSANDDDSSETNTDGDDNTGQNDDGEASGTNQPSQPEIKPEPVVNTYGVSVGGLSDGEIEGLVSEWFNSVWRPKQSPPNGEGGWSLNEWGVWVNGLITHMGGIDGYRSPADYWLRENAECLAYVEKMGKEKHPGVAVSPTASGSSSTAGSSESASTAVAATRPDEETLGGDSFTAGGSSDNDESTGSSGSGSSETDDGSSDGATTSEEVPDLGGPATNQQGDIEKIKGRAVDIHVPSSYDKSESQEWGLVICLAGVAGNTSYLKEKLRTGCSKAKCIFAGLKAKNASGSPFGHRWEADQGENVEFIEEVISRVEGHYGLSSSRTFLVGFSNGAGFIKAIGTTVDKSIEGYASCEGGGFFSSEDKQVVISGSQDIGSSQSGNRWSAYCPGMGHKFPGLKLPMYQDPGVEKTKDGKTINGEAILNWLDS